MTDEKKDDRVLGILKEFIKTCLYNWFISKCLPSFSLKKKAPLVLGRWFVSKILFGVVMVIHLERKSVNSRLKTLRWKYDAI